MSANLCVRKYLYVNVSVCVSLGVYSQTGSYRLTQVTPALNSFLFDRKMKLIYFSLSQEHILSKGPNLLQSTLAK